MKKIIFAIAIVLTIGFAANAQGGGTDGLFGSWDNGVNRGFGDEGDLEIANPGIGLFGETENSTAPLGSGLLVLTALGAGYAVCRRKR